MRKDKEPGFFITMGKGFHVVFVNGYTVSVQFGPGNYCGNYDHIDFSQEGNRVSGEKGSPTAEVAWWGPDGGMISFSDDDEEYPDTVKGYQTPEQVLELLKKAAAMPKQE